ncbi:MAG: hypothetical protein J6K89_04370 [Oscillospiraceae bacterium]|nr:hypothetical protein [Oscillospiraceae bacterium]
MIDKARLREAMGILRSYRQGKGNLEQRLIANEQWYKLRHWDYLRGSSGEQVEPVSAWLFNCIANKHADAMDNFPSPVLLPREEDRGEAKLLSSIVPVLLEQSDFEQVYSDAWDDKLRSGTAIYGVFWEPSALGGLGDISVRRVDPINLFWQPGIGEIQSSRNVFHVELQDTQTLEEQYPQLKGKLTGSGADVSKYIYDDTVDTASLRPVVDWYYHRDGLLHYCKFVGEELLFASENLPQYRDRGWYDHGKYPFVFDPMFKVKGSPCGFGFIDVAKSAQEYIDRCNQAVMKNLLANATPRHFIRSDGSVNEEEYLDLTRPLIHVDGQLGKDSILPVQGNSLPSIYVHILNNKIDELKETTGNRDISAGGKTSGVTAASAIAALQEAGSKLTRDANKGSYRAFRKVVLLIIELIRQFYDMPRCFRIIGENGAVEFARYSNAGLRLQSQGEAFGISMGSRLPLFDIQVSAQKASPYATLSQNELALQFYAQGFFEPNRAQQALLCLEMMDFDRKGAIMEAIARNAAQFHQVSREAQAAKPPFHAEPKATRDARIRTAMNSGE